MDREEIRRLIGEEIARPEIQKSLTRPSATGRMLKFLQSPAIITVLTFFLTTLVGTYITQEVADRSRRTTELETALDSVRSFATEAAELRVLQGHFLEAMERKVSTTELNAAKDSYDESYEAWHTSRYRNYLTIRSFFGFTQEIFAERLISRTIHGDFKIFNDCLDETWDGRTFGDAAREKMNACLARKDRKVPANDRGVDSVDYRQEKIFQCSRRIFDLLHHFVAKDINCSASSWTEPDENGLTIVDKSSIAVWNECGVGEIRQDLFGPGLRGQVLCTIKKDEWW